jgi:hypothetical protein
VVICELLEHTLEEDMVKVYCVCQASKKEGTENVSSVELLWEMVHVIVREVSEHHQKTLDLPVLLNQLLSIAENFNGADVGITAVTFASRSQPALFK